MSKRLTTKEFIEQAKEIHGNKYDYSDTVYTDTKSKVTIKCNMCGYKYKILPGDHLLGFGCERCEPSEANLDEFAFIEQAKEMYGDLYNYNFVDYKTLEKKVRIKCNTCGQFFERTPRDFLKKHLDCPHAVKARRLQEKIERHKKSPNHRKYGYY